MLRESGVGRGTVVAIWAPNSAEWCAVGLACHLLGAVLAPIDALLSADEAHEQVIASSAALVFVDGAPAAFQDKPTCLDLKKLPRSDDCPSIDDLAGDDPIAQFRTSGTTGAPKVFRLSLRNIGWNVRAIAGTGLVTAEDRVLMPLPFHHVFPWITATLTCLTIGAPLILPESPTGPQIAEALKLGRATIIVGVPRLYEAMLAGIRARLASKGHFSALAFDGGLGLAKRLHRISGGRLGSALMAPLRRAIAPELRLLVSGGAHLPVEVEAELEALGWDVRTGYGLAETAASVTAPPLARPAGSVGQPISGCEVRIDEPGEDGTGEIELRGSMVFSGYIDNAKANAEAFTEDGYFRTGDLGRLDADGFLFVTGRKKEVIVLAGGDKLYPEDVEQRYLADPQVAEIGVLERDGALVALIVPNLAETAKSGSANAEDAIRVALGTVARRLPSTWRLAGFALTSQPLPRTRLGKLRRFRLPELYDRAKAGIAESGGRALTAEERAWVEMPPRAGVWAILLRDHGTGAFDLNSHLQLDLGLNSFSWMTLGVAIDEATGVRFDQADMAAISTVRDLLPVSVKRRPRPAKSPRSVRDAEAGTRTLACPAEQGGAAVRLDHSIGQQCRHAPALRSHGRGGGHLAQSGSCSHLPQSCQRHGCVRRGSGPAVRHTPTRRMGGYSAAPFQHAATARLLESYADISGGRNSAHDCRRLCRRNPCQRRGPGLVSRRLALPRPPAPAVPRRHRPRHISLARAGRSHLHLRNI